MSIPNCPKCGRATYTKKYNSCTADGCSLNHSRRLAEEIVERRRGVLTRLAEHDTQPVTVRDEKPVTPKRGPKATYASPAEKQRAYRERKKASASA